MFLSASLVEFDRTFVNLSCERSICIENNSDEHLPFSWSFGSSSRQPKVRPSAAPGGVDVEAEDNFELANCGSFSIKPASGRIWAKSKRNIRIGFTPDRATAHSATAILNIAGRSALQEGSKALCSSCVTGNSLKAGSNRGAIADRLREPIPSAKRLHATSRKRVTGTAPLASVAENLVFMLRCRENGLELQLHGVGTGPQAKFTRSELDFGEVVVFTQKSLDVDIVNTVGPTRAALCTACHRSGGSCGYSSDSQQHPANQPTAAFGQGIFGYMKRASVQLPLALLHVVSARETLLRPSP